MNQEVGAQCKAVGGSTRYSGGRSVTRRHSMGDSQTVSIKSADASVFWTKNCTCVPGSLLKHCNSKKLESATSIGEWLNTL